jgi:hypothetical protein
MYKSQRTPVQLQAHDYAMRFGFLPVPRLIEGHWSGQKQAGFDERGLSTVASCYYFDSC